MAKARSMVILLFIFLFTLGCAEETPKTENPVSSLTVADTPIPSAGPSSLWQKSTINPIYVNYAKDPALSFTGDPEVFYANGKYYLWYASLVQFLVPDLVPYGPCDGSIQKCALPMELATSDDGINWKKFDRGTEDPKDDYVIIRDSENSWDSGSIETAAIVFEDGKFKMWFSGTKAANEEERFLSHRIGYAESPDGIAWAKYNNSSTSDELYAKSDPVLHPRSDNWDSLFVSDPTVIKEGGKFKMWYGGAGVKDGQSYNALGYAESEDGINWIRRDNPVIMPTAEEKNLINGPEVIKTNVGYELFYYTGLPGIQYATSKDGIEWEKKGAILTTTANRWDDSEVSSPSVVIVDGEYRLYYTGSSCAMESEKLKKGECKAHIKIGLATKPVQ